MTIKYIFLIINLFVFSTSSKSQSVDICGLVLDKLTKEPIIGASVYDSIHMKGKTTDVNGYFCITADTSSLSVNVSYVGYCMNKIFLKSTKDTLIVIYLKPGLLIKDVRVTHSNSTKQKLSLINIPIRQMQSIPSLTGEPDIIKNFQLMPGIQMGDEGSSGMYVRGGTPDQNLFLMDDNPLFYMNHLGGFISVFDINTIKSVNLYKGDFPARFGNRLSSVVDIRLKDGNSNKTQKELMIGSLASKFYIEGPVKDKTTYLFSLRRCNIDLLMRPFSLMASNGKEMQGYTFYDMTAKSVHRINRRNKISLLVYSGRDKIFFKENYEQTEFNNKYKSYGNVRWGNIISSFKWNRIINPNCYININAGYSQFFYSINSKIEYDMDKLKRVQENAFRSWVQNSNLSCDIVYFGDNFKIKSGLTFKINTFKPVIFNSETENINGKKDTLLLHKLNVLETTAYVDTDWNITKRLNINAGFFCMSWPSNKFYSIDPRLSFNYELFYNLDVTFSYNIAHQYIHLLSKSGTGIPSELWVPSTRRLKPEKSEQFSIGLILNNKNFDFSIEAYHKKMYNLIALKSGESLLNSINWKEKTEGGGIGHARGLEFLVKKLHGKHTGWIGYTLSKNTRQFPFLNNNKVFPFKFDRRHEINIVYSCNLRENITFSLNWIYATGNYITIATRKHPTIDYDYWGDINDFLFTEAHYYEGINNFKTPDYHRMDIGFNFSKEVKKGMRNIYLGAYNLYNQKNPYYFYFKDTSQGRKLYKFSLFPIIPSIGYSLKF